MAHYPMGDRDDGQWGNSVHGVQGIGHGAYGQWGHIGDGATEGIGYMGPMGNGGTGGMGSIGNGAQGVGAT